MDKKASIILITISSILPPTNPQNIPSAPPQSKAIKEPKKVITNQSQSIYAGYGAQKEIIEYQTVSNTFDALVNFKERQNEEVVDDIKVEDIRGEVRIKVEQDCRDYIKNNGKTQSIIVQGKNYNVITDDGTREYLGQKYFVFYLESTT